MQRVLILESYIRNHIKSVTANLEVNFPVFQFPLNQQYITISTSKQVLKIRFPVKKIRSRKHYVSSRRNMRYFRVHSETRPQTVYDHHPTKSHTEDICTHSHKVALFATTLTYSCAKTPGRRLF
jgi:hypothetical protein